MRQITADINQAFYEGRKLTKSNTFTDGENVYLHGNKIAYHDEHGVWVSLAGWNTVTTRERVNGLLPRKAEGGFVQRNHGAYYVKYIDGKQKLTAIDENGWHFFGHDGLILLCGDK